MTRTVLTCTLTAALSAGLWAFGTPAASAYEPVLTLPGVVDGRSLYSFAHDPVDHRLYAASEQGLYWADLSQKDGRFKGPLLRKRIESIEVAPDTGRLFFTTREEVGMLKLRSNDAPVRISGFQWRTARWAYEPSRRQMYLATRDGRVRVFDAESGERAVDVPVPGEFATMLEAVPGKVFVTLNNRSGLFVIDAATKAVVEWPVEGRLVTPAYLDADPTGEFLFATYDRYVVAIDIASRRVVGRLITAVGGRIAVDPQRRWLVVAQPDEPGYPRLRLAAYRADAGGLTEVARFDNPALGLNGLESLRTGGFLQSGHLSLLVWAPVASSGSGAIH